MLDKEFTTLSLIFDRSDSTLGCPIERIRNLSNILILEGGGLERIVRQGRAKASVLGFKLFNGHVSEVVCTKFEGMLARVEGFYVLDIALEYLEPMLFLSNVFVDLTMLDHPLLMSLDHQLLV